VSGIWSHCNISTTTFSCISVTTLKSILPKLRRGILALATCVFVARMVPALLQQQHVDTGQSIKTATDSDRHYWNGSKKNGEAERSVVDEAQPNANFLRRRRGL